MAPTIVIQNLLMTLSYPATLATTIAIVPDVRSYDLPLNRSFGSMSRLCAPVVLP